MLRKKTRVGKKEAGKIEFEFSRVAAVAVHKGIPRHTVVRQPLPHTTTIRDRRRRFTRTRGRAIARPRIIVRTIVIQPRVIIRLHRHRV